MIMSDAFSAWLDALDVPTETIQLCADYRLVQRAEELHRQLEAERASDEVGGASLGGTSIEEELEEVRRRIEAKSITLTVKSPSEDVMLKLDSKRESDPEGWAAAVITAAMVEPKMTLADVAALRERLDRGTWNVLFRRVLDVAVNRSLTVPFSWSDSGSGRN